MMGYLNLILFFVSIGYTFNGSMMNPIDKPRTKGKIVSK